MENNTSTSTPLHPKLKGQGEEGWHYEKPILQKVLDY